MDKEKLIESFKGELSKATESFTSLTSRVESLEKESFSEQLEQVTKILARHEHKLKKLSEAVDASKEEPKKEADEPAKEEPKKEAEEPAKEEPKKEAEDEDKLKTLEKLAEELGYDLTKKEADEPAKEEPKKEAEEPSKEEPAKAESDDEDEDDLEEEDSTPAEAPKKPTMESAASPIAGKGAQKASLKEALDKDFNKMLREFNL